MKSIIREELLVKANGGGVDSFMLIKADSDYIEINLRYLDFILCGDKEKASDLIFDSVKNGASIKKLYLEVFQCTQYEIGRLWQAGVISVAQEHFCTALTQVIMAQLYPYFFREKTERNGFKFLGACMSNELHEMGIRMVSDFLEHDGWDTYYLGANMPTKDILSSIENLKHSVVGLSTSRTENINEMAHTINEIRKRFSYKDVKIIVGGHPFNSCPNLWENIGADGFAKDAEEARSLCSSLVRR